MAPSRGVTRAERILKILEKEFRRVEEKERMGKRKVSHAEAAMDGRTAYLGFKGTHDHDALQKRVEGLQRKLRGLYDEKMQLRAMARRLRSLLLHTVAHSVDIGDHSLVGQQRAWEGNTEGKPMGNREARLAFLYEGTPGKRTTEMTGSLRTPGSPARAFKNSGKNGMKRKREETKATEPRAMEIRSKKKKKKMERRSSPESRIPHSPLKASPQTCRGRAQTINQFSLNHLSAGRESTTPAAAAAKAATQNVTRVGELLQAAEEGHLRMLELWTKYTNRLCRADKALRGGPPYKGLTREAPLRCLMLHLRKHRSLVEARRVHFQREKRRLKAERGQLYQEAAALWREVPRDLGANSGGCWYKRQAGEEDTEKYSDLLPSSFFSVGTG
ncbi:unnamed protein product [Discosporangium mesarthrocarpum]